MHKKSCTIIVLNYNGKTLLEECLPSIVEAVNYDGIDHEIMVVDNASSDDSCEFVRKFYPSIRLISLTENKYLTAYNETIKSAKYDYVVLLNNDLRVEKDFIQHLLKHFDDENVFAVTSCMKSWDGHSLLTGKVLINLNYFFFRPQIILDNQDTCLTFRAAGGASIFHKRKFIELSGFDNLYKPGYGEDTDLSYRAWKRGWKVIYEPKSIMYHKWRATLGKIYKKGHLKRICARNTLFFIWKNITDFKFTIFHCLLLPMRIFWEAIHGNLNFGIAFFIAISHLPAVLKRRIKEQKKIRSLADKEIAQIISTGVFPLRSNLIRNDAPLRFKITGFVYKLIQILTYLPARIITRIEMKLFNIQNVTNIIVFIGGGIGNLVLTQPFVKSCLKAWPKSNISLIVTSDVLKELSSLLFPEADVFVLPGKKRRFFTALRYLKYLIPQRKFSICFSTFLERRRPTSWWGKYLGAKMIIGFEERKWAPWQTISLDFDKSTHEIERNLKMLKIIGKNPQIVATSLEIPKDLMIWANDYLDNLGERFIGIHPGTDKISIGRRWAAVKFRELINTFLEEYKRHSVLFFMGPHDKDIGKDIAKKINNKRFIVIEDLGINQVVGLINKCECFISNDSGLMHIAGALKIPLVAIWGPTNLRKSCPTSNKQIIIKKDLSCAPCYEIGKAISCQHRTCLNQISVEEVMKACNSLIEGLPSKNKQRMTVDDFS